MDLEAAALPPGYNRTSYRVPQWRTLVFTVAFLLLLPFAASLPILIFQRAAAGQTGAIGPLLVLTLFMGSMIFLLGAELLRAVRTHISLGAAALTFRAPRRGTLNPWRSVTGSISYRDIKAIEVRNEVVGGTWAPSVVAALYILTHDGRDICLGAHRPKPADHAFPLLLIARQIAQRSGVRLTFNGSLWRTIHGRYAAASIGKARGVLVALTMAEINTIKQQHRRHMLLAANLAVLIIVAGLTLDFASR